MPDLQTWFFYDVTHDSAGHVWDQVVAFLGSELVQGMVVFIFAVLIFGLVASAIRMINRETSWSFRAGREIGYADGLTGDIQISDLADRERERYLDGYGAGVREGYEDYLKAGTIMDRRQAAAARIEELRGGLAELVDGYGGSTAY